MKFSGTLVGDLRGSLGGVTASRNKAGGFLRQRVTPTNPQTNVQQANRAAFGSAGSSFHALTPLQKQLWNQFAIDYFTPRGGRIPGVTYSGQQAYTSLLATVTRSNNLIRETDFSGGVIDIVPFDFSIAPPTGQMSARITATGSPSAPPDGYPIVITNASMTVAGALTVNVGIGDQGPVSPSLTGDLKTVGDNSQPVGINFYISQKGTQQAGLQNGGKLSLIGSTGLLTDVTVSNYATPIIMGQADIDISGRKKWFVMDQWVDIHAFLVGKNGQSQPIGKVSVQLS